MDDVLNFAVMIAAAKLVFLVCLGLVAYSVYAQPATFTTGYPDKINSSDELFPGLYKPLPFELPASGIVTASGSGSLLFTAAVRKGKLNGHWQSWYANGIACDSGRMVNNLPDGEWIFRNEDGEIRAIRHYSADKFLRITGEMQHYHPKRSFFYLAALYQRKKMQALHYLDAGYSFPGSSNLTPVSTLKQLAEENTNPEYPYRPVFVQCIHDGLYINYFAGGLAKDSGMYKDGMKSGKWIHRDTVQQGWFQGAYKHGLPVKEWKHFNEEGRLVEILFYDQTGRLSWRKKINRQATL